MEKKSSKIEIKTKVLSALMTPALKSTIKLESLIRDHYMNGVTLWDTDLTTMMELIVSSKVLIAYLQGLLDEAEEAEVDSVHLSPQESQILAALVKSLGVSYELKVGNISLREH
tara:strand:- start:757 stop:1098 length:342 start_codon:yes stop_codon:yes gene_type:complete